MQSPATPSYQLVSSVRRPFLTNLETNYHQELEREKWRRNIRSIARNAWDAHVKNAWGFNEFQPVSQTGDNPFGGIGAAIVEEVDATCIMNLTSRYEQACEWIKTNLDFEQVHHFANIYQTTNRVLGGLIAACQLAGNELFMEQAEEMGRRLSLAFNSANCVPYPYCHLGGPLKDTFTLSEDALSAIEDGFLCYGDLTSQSEPGGLSLAFRALTLRSLLLTYEVYIAKAIGQCRL